MKFNNELELFQAVMPQNGVLLVNGESFSGKSHFAKKAASVVDMDLYGHSEDGKWLWPRLEKFIQYSDKTIIAGQGNVMYERIYELKDLGYFTGVVTALPKYEDYIANILARGVGQHMGYASQYYVGDEVSEQIKRAFEANDLDGVRSLFSKDEYVKSARKYGQYYFVQFDRDVDSNRQQYTHQRIFNRTLDLGYVAGKPKSVKLPALAKPFTDGKAVIMSADVTKPLRLKPSEKYHIYFTGNGGSLGYAEANVRAILDHGQVRCWWPSVVISASCYASAALASASCNFPDICAAHTIFGHASEARRYGIMHPGIDLEDVPFGTYYNYVHRGVIEKFPKITGRVFSKDELESNV